MGSSLVTGVAALPDDVDAALVMLADMPRVGAAEVARLKAAFDPDEGRAICVPIHKGRRGNPVLFGRQFFPELRAVAGGKGARDLLARHAEQVFEVVMDDDAVLGRRGHAGGVGGGGGVRSTAPAARTTRGGTPLPPGRRG
jgi:molybdenum cofactor cytidylyltransferase